jgi:Polysaccharide deacetylase
MIQALSDYYRVPEGLLDRVLASDSSGDVGFFRFGPNAICYGRCASVVSTKIENAALYDASKHIRFSGTEVRLPFDPAEVIENLRREQYVHDLVPGRERFLAQEWVLKAYYFVRALLPVSVRRHLQRAYFRDWQSRPFPKWPVDFSVDTLHERFLRLSMRAVGLPRVPFIWFWPDGAPNCLIMTHDVETRAGRDFTPQLMDLDESYGIKASFQVIPEKRYEVPDEYVREIQRRGFEFNIHDLNHDGHLYRKREEFLRRARKINEYAHHYQARGFRAGAMYRQLDWYDAYEFSYDMSLTNVAHLEPKRGGCCTVFPFFIGRILELPLTTSQDYSVFHILNDYSIGLWKQQLDLIRQRNGLMSFIAHPDYLIERRARRVYESLLEYLRQMVDREKIWMALPGEVDHWWRARSQMKLVQKGGCWEIQGPEAERARVAFAVVEGDRLVYEVTERRCQESGHP